MEINKAALDRYITGNYGEDQLRDGDGDDDQSEGSPPAKARLENWSLLEQYGDPYKAPEQRALILRGTVYDHHKFPDGTPIRTAVLLKFDPVKRYAITCELAFFTLGQPHPDYAAQYPEANHANHDGDNQPHH